MNRMLMVLVVLMLACGPALAAKVEAVKGSKDDVVDCATDIRPAVLVIFAKGEASGQSLQEMIHEALKIGPNLCGLLLVSAEKGYDPQAVLEALLNEGIAADALAKAAIEAGYDRKLVAAVIERKNGEGLGFTPAGGNPTAVLGPPTNVGGGGRGGSVSPSSL